MGEVTCSHFLQVCNRTSGTFTGIKDVISFDPDTILMDTELGVLTIKGTELHVNRLCLEQGEVDLDGMIQSLQYTEHGIQRKKEKGSLIKRLFR